MNQSELLSQAWALIANAGGGDWFQETAEWHDAAAKWRNDYFAMAETLPPTEERLRVLEEKLVEVFQAVFTLQLIALGQHPAAVRPNPDDDVRIADGSVIKMKDIPIDPATGLPDEEWARANCTCATHRAMREGNEEVKGLGQYL